MCAPSRSLLSSCVRWCRECCIQSKCSTKVKMKALLEMTWNTASCPWQEGHVFSPAHFFSDISSPRRPLRVYFGSKRLCFLVAVERWAMWRHEMDRSAPGWTWALAGSCFKAFKCCSSVVNGSLFRILVCAISIFWHGFSCVCASHFLSPGATNSLFTFPVSSVNSSLLLFCARNSLCDNHS